MTSGMNGPPDKQGRRDRLTRDQGPANRRTLGRWQVRAGPAMMLLRKEMR
jgi:hypothetical protein